MLKDLFLVGLGSFVGGVARYLISLAMKSCSTGFPWGTFVVNLLGCFLIGLFGAATDKYSNLPSQLSLLLTVGLCGGFTTFSTFSNEALKMLQAGNYLMLCLYIAGSMTLGIAAVFLGYQILK